MDYGTEILILGCSNNFSIENASLEPTKTYQRFEEWHWEEFDEFMSYCKARNYEKYMENLKVKERYFSEEEIRNELEDVLKKLDELKKEKK